MKFSTGVFSLMRQDVLTTVFQLTISVFVARSLGPVEMGLQVILFALIQYADKFGRLRLEDASVYLYKKGECTLKQANRSLILLSIPQIAVVLLVLWAGRGLLENLLFKTQLPGGIAYGLMMAHVPFYFLLMNVRKLSLAANELKIYNNTFWTIPFIQLILLVSIRALTGSVTLEELLAVSLFSTAFIAVLAQMALPFEPDSSKAPQGLTRKLFFWGSRFYLATIPQYLQLRLDLMFVAYYLTPAQAAFYSLATTASEILWKLPNAVQNLLFPVSTPMSDADAAQFTVNACRKLLVILVIFAGLGSIFITPTVKLLYGERFISVVAPFLILLPGSIFMGIGKVIASYLHGRGLAGALVKISTAAFILNALFNLALIPELSIYGAALASTLTYFFTTTLLARLLLKRSKISVWQFIPGKEDFQFYAEKLQGKLPA